MECNHKFKPGKDGMLTCELCGFKRAPRGTSSQPVNTTREPDTSKGAERVEKQRRSGRRFDRVLNDASDVID